MEEQVEIKVSVDKRLCEECKTTEEMFTTIQYPLLHWFVRFCDPLFAEAANREQTLETEDRHLGESEWGGYYKTTTIIHTPVNHCYGHLHKIINLELTHPVYVHSYIMHHLLTITNNGFLFLLTGLYQCKLSNYKTNMVNDCCYGSSECRWSYCKALSQSCWMSYVALVAICRELVTLLDTINWNINR